MFCRRLSKFQDTNIYLLSSGAIPPNPAELLGSSQMKQLLDIVGNNFNYIVIDSPPIASFTDGVLISALVDGVLLVVHGGKTSRQVVKRTRQMLHEIGAKIIGVVLNKADMSSERLLLSLRLQRDITIRNGEKRSSQRESTR